MVTSCSILNQNQDKCNCDKIVNTYNHMKEQILVVKNNYFAPEKAITFYADGSQTNPQINKDINIILTCTDIKLIEPTKELVYYISENKLEEIRKWVDNNCSDFKK